MKIKSLVLASLFVFGCQNLRQMDDNGESGYAIKPPFKSISIAALVFKISTAVVNELRTPKGSKITIPANTIVSKDGKPITDGVTVAFKEFHTAAEIMVSGIPMLYKQGDSVCGFESAGMFDMQATLNSDTLEIAKGKTINVELASYKKDNDFNTYLFDTKAGKWNELTKNNVPIENSVKEELADEIAKTELSLLDNQKSINSFFSLNINEKTYPEFKPFKAMVWQYKGSKPENDPGKNKRFFSEQIENAQIKPVQGEDNLFEITLTNSSTTLKFEASPAKSYGNIDSKVDESATIKTEVSKKKNILKRMADFSRSLTIAKFGIFNCDRIYSNVSTRRVIPELDFNKIQVSEVKIIYLLCPAQNIAINYSNGYNVVFDQSQTNYLVAIMNNSDVMIAKPENFDGPVNADGKMNFKFEPTKTPVTTFSDLSNIISGL